MERNKIYEFGPFRFDTGAGRLLRDVNAIARTPQVTDTLLYLLENHGRVLPKEELISAVWGGRRVEEANLTQNISVLRKALGGSSEGIKIITTFPGRGYEFLVHAGGGAATVGENEDEIGRPPCLRRQDRGRGSQRLQECAAIGHAEPRATIMWNGGARRAW